MVIAFYGALLLVARGPLGRSDPLTLWGSAMLCGAVGLTLLALRAHPPLPHLAANLFILTGVGLSWTAARIFMSQRPRKWLVAAGPALWLALTLIPPLDVGQPGAVVTASLIGGIYTVATVVALGSRDDERLPSRAAALVMLAFHAVVFLGRAAIGLLAMAGLIHGIGPGVVNVLIIEALLFTSGMAFILLAMTKDRAELQNAASLIAARDAARSVADAKSRFLARMSHEVRTPLNGILGLAQVLVLDHRLAPDQREWAETLESAGRHLLSIVNDALDLAKVEAGRMEIAVAPMALAPLLQDTLALLRGLADAGDVVLFLDLAPDLPDQVAGDATRLRQVLLNLLSNAVRMTPRGGQVTLTAAPARQPPILRFQVIDTGPGIPPARRGELFKDFAASGPVGRDGAQGSGLGLAICAALIRAMGGQIGFTPGPKERGAIFWVEVPLPAMPALAAAPLPARSPAPLPATLVAAATVPVEPHQAIVEVAPPTRPSILVADDVASNRKMAQAMLEQAGYATIAVTGGIEAVAAVAQGGIDVVLMDMRMPDLDGMAATRQIRALPKPAGRVKVIALTADAMPEHILACEQAGMDGHVAKPVERARLLAEITRVTAG